MILGYKQQFPNGDPTNFREKIWRGTESTNDIPYQLIPEYEKSLTLDLKPKFHSIREDAKDRWSGFEGDIHHFYNVRQPNAYCFLRNKYVGYQRIQIIWTRVVGKNDKGNDEIVGKSQLVLVDGRAIADEKLEQLAVNDGFNDIDHFFTWFDQDFSGKILHWTKIRY